MNPLKTTVLVVDDEPGIRDALTLSFQKDYKVLTAASGKEALQQISCQPVDLVLLDLRVPDMNGMEILSEIQKIDGSIKVIVVTAVKTVSAAVEAMKKGAYDYINKPFDLEELKVLMEKALEKRQLMRQNSYFRSQLLKGNCFEDIIGRSSKMQEVFQIIDRISNTDSTVLISGESGTGKELAARAIHNRSHRQCGLFVTVNCAAIPENLMESELFGHERGAFTGAAERRSGKFEIADSGTIFLDEISSLPFNLQGKLLRVLQEKEYEPLGSSKQLSSDVRILSATNRTLKGMVEDQKFREDLYYRLNVIPLELPPLRERKEDIPLLADYFLLSYNHELGKNVKRFSEEALQSLTEYHWPGNIRELKNLVERLVVLAKEDRIDKDKLPVEISKSATGLRYIDEEDDFKVACRQFESQFIQQAVEKAGGSKSKAAKLLGIHRNTLLNIERRHRPSGKRKPA